MAEKKVTSYYSQCPFQIFLCDAIGVISTGSAFFYEHNKQSYLITNWHNVSGRHFLTKIPLTSNGRFPTYLIAKLASYPVGHSSGHITSAPLRIELYENYNPKWLEHPNLGSVCDVIAIPFTKHEQCPEGMHNPANKLSKVQIPVQPGCAAFVIGYPASISIGFGLPVWKAGYIASEPFFDVTLGGELSEIFRLQGGETLPAFFIDTLTREGMSGSPVFASYSGSWDASKPYEIPKIGDDLDSLISSDIFVGETRMEFVGCYSGRIGKKEEGAALGLCWRNEAISEICSGSQLAANPHVNKSS